MEQSKTVSHLIIDNGRCTGCGLCVSACIRKNITVRDKKAVETQQSVLECFDCGHCMAICPNDCIRLTRYPDKCDGSKPCTNKPMLDYGGFIDFLTQRRSIRWMTKDPVTQEEFDMIFKAARNSPSAENSQDVRFAVIDKELCDFEKHVAEIIKPLSEEFPRIGQFVDYIGDRSKYEFDPFLWTGKQIILAFSKIPANAHIAMARVELAAYAMGLGGFYSRWIAMADEQDHDRLMEYFPEIPKDCHLNSVFIIGHPKVKYRRTVPRDDVVVHMR